MNKNRLSRTIAGALCFSLACISQTAFSQQHSALWGSNGELWDPLGRLPDYSYAGYRSGEANIPDVAVVTNIIDFGAIPNDNLDDSTAIQAAIDATSNGAVLVPKGSYRLEQPLNIRNSGVVIRGVGDGLGESMFYVPQNATERAGGNHEMGFSWGSKGFIVLFQGNSPTGTTDVVSNAARGDRTIRIADTSDFQVGGQLVLRMQDDSLFGSLFRHLHNNRLSDWSEGSRDAWCGASDSWPFTIDAINGNDVTLKQPLPFDIRREWNPTAQRGRAITEVGIENLRIRFRYAAPAKHLTERGFNAIRFERVQDSWIRNVTLEDIDNGISVGRQSSRNTLENITIEGRRGHHATTISGGSSYNLISNIELQVDEVDDEWIHAFTIDHAAQGNVVQIAQSNKTLRLDLHRDSPFENLYTEILTTSNFRSGGNKCAGPHTAARLTLWNAAGLFEGLDEYLLKGVDSQVNVIANTDRPGVTSKDGLWVENIADVQPANLYKAQLARRLGTEEPAVTVSLVSTTTRENNGTVDIKARLSAPSRNDVTVGVHSRPVSAVNGEDYYGLTRSITILAGTLEASVTMILIDDYTREPEETYQLIAYSVDGAQIENDTAIVTITDDDEVSLPDLVIEDGSVTEGESYAVRLSLSEPASNTISVSMSTQIASAVEGRDYYGIYEIIEFAPGETEKRVPITILDDDEIESTEIFRQSIISASGANVKRRRAVTTITDND